MWVYLRVDEPRQPWANTLVYYQFEQNLNDSSGNGYNITTSSDYSFVEVWWQYVVQDEWSIRLWLPYAPFNTIWTWDFAISFWFYPIMPTNTSNREPVVLWCSRSASPYIWPWIFYDYYGYGDEWMTNPDKKIYWRTARWVYGLWGLTADYINWWHHFVMTRISWTVYCYIDKVLVCQYLSSSDISGITNLGGFVGNSSNREPQWWGTSWAKWDSLILENIWWTSQKVSDYFDQTKATYWIS